jgi:sarcosine oxidase subunit beta
MAKNYDLIIIGAGSIGLPAALEAAKRNVSVLVIESEHGPGQENNKKLLAG